MFKFFNNNKKAAVQPQVNEAPVVEVKKVVPATPVVEEVKKSKQELALEAVLAKLAQKEREAEDLKLQRTLLEEKNAQEQASLDAEVLQKRQFNELLLKSAEAVKAAHEEVQQRQAELDSSLMSYIESKAQRDARIKEEEDKENRRIAAMMEWLDTL